jgi:hypothetical protein
MKALIALATLLASASSHAHVKWFSNYSFQEPPLNLSQLNTPVFWGLFLLSIVSMPIMVLLDRWADKSEVYVKTNAFLDRYSENGPLIMRIAMGAVLLMSWQGDSIVAPEIGIPDPVWGWLQLLLALLLIFKETTFIAGLGIVGFYLLGITQEGLFHMLDYIVYPAIGLYLFFSYSKNEKIKNLDLPVLYSGLGFSLCWVAFEKLIYPYWGLSVLAKAPALTMSLDHSFFLMACAFVEFSLGYLLIICLLHRPLAIVITLVFFTTTCFFGKTEVVGHTLLHGALLVFIVKGPGHYYQAPIRFHKNLWFKSLFAAVNFVILFVVLAIPYQKLSQEAHASSLASKHPEFVVQASDPKPVIMIHSSKDPNGGWNLNFMTENFTFTPEAAGAKEVSGQGHAHLYVDGVKVARVYGPWFHLNVGSGIHKVKVTLNTNNHKDYVLDSKVIGDEIEISEDRKVKGGHQH